MSHFQGADVARIGALETGLMLGIGDFRLQGGIGLDHHFQEISETQEIQGSSHKEMNPGGILGKVPSRAHRIHSLFVVEELSGVEAEGIGEADFPMIGIISGPEVVLVTEIGSNKYAMIETTIVILTAGGMKT
jgi:hypothetical protein